MKIERRTLLRSLFIAPLVAVFGKLPLPKPVERVFRFTTGGISADYAKYRENYLRPLPTPKTWIVDNGETLDLAKTGPADKIILLNGTVEWTNSVGGPNGFRNITMSQEAIQKFLDAT